MSCALFDIGCRLHQFIAPFWFWIFWGFWTLVALIALGALYKLKQIGGWPAVFGALTLGAYGFGYWRGRRGDSLNPIENVPDDSPDGENRSHRKPKVHIPPKKGQRVYNPDTGVWELK